jgi:hypothetical protein
MTAVLIVRATVLEADRAAFDHWYETEHLPDAKAGTKARAAWRGWSDTDPGVHAAFYEFDALSQIQDVLKDEAGKALIDEFDRVWQGRVTRTREVIEIKQRM